MHVPPVLWLLLANVKKSPGFMSVRPKIIFYMWESGHATGALQLRFASCVSMDKTYLSGMCTCVPAEKALSEAWKRQTAETAGLRRLSHAFPPTLTQSEVFINTSCCISVLVCNRVWTVSCACLSDAETALKMMMMTGSVPLAALQAATGHRQRLQQAAAASYLTTAGIRHAAAVPLTAITPQPTMYVTYTCLFQPTQ